VDANDVPYGPVACKSIFAIPGNPRLGRIFMRNTFAHEPSGHRKLRVVLITERRKGETMKINRKVVVGVLAAAGVVGGVASATPIFNLAIPVLTTANHSGNIEASGNFEANGGEFRAFMKTEGPSTVLIQEGAFGPGGSTGWHSHPGILALTLVSGTLDWYDGDCKKTSYKAGDAWTEGSQLHDLKVTSTTNAQVFVTYIIAQGAAPRIDEAAPPCAAALGLD
jgi:quercetin dioxygenase-like cupin family protein